MDHKPFINYYKEAFALPLNLAFLAVMVVSILSVGFITGVEELFMILTTLTASIEMFYLAIAPKNKRFVRAVNSRLTPTLTQINKQFQSFKYLQQLNGSFLDKYMEFYRKKQSIIENIFKEENKSKFVDPSYVDKLNSLEAYYVELLYGVEQYQNLILSNGNQTIDSEMQRILKEMENSSDKVKSELNKRYQLLNKRKVRIVDAKENINVAKVQIDTVEDTISYVLEQSISLKNPLEISRAIDEVISSAETHSTNFDEIDQVLNDFQSPNPQIGNIDLEINNENYFEKN